MSFRLTLERYPTSIKQSLNFNQVSLIFNAKSILSKDNTSASETSKSQNMDGLFAPNANTRPNRASRPARHQSRAAKPPSSGFNSAGKPFEDDGDADAMASAAIDAQNQTVSELLSMLSGSCESH